MNFSSFVFNASGNSIYSFDNIFCINSLSLELINLVNERRVYVNNQITNNK